MSGRPSTLLAFDYGDIRIGVAVGQTVTATASPLTSVRVRGRCPDWNTITSLVRTWEPDALVVGLPYNMDGSDQETTHSARRFGRQLHGRFQLPVHMVDERLTTREAKSRLAEQGDPDGDDDPVAAQVILESWFSERASGEAAT